MRFRAWGVMPEVASTLAIAEMRAPVSFRLREKETGASRWMLPAKFCASAKHLATWWTTFADAAAPT
jgi:hypothetical protein